MRNLKPFWITFVVITLLVLVGAPLFGEPMNPLRAIGSGICDGIIVQVVFVIFAALFLRRKTTRGGDDDAEPIRQTETDSQR